MIMPFLQASAAWESYRDGVGTLQTPRGVEGVTVRLLRLGKAEIEKKLCEQRESVARLTCTADAKAETPPPYLNERYAER